MRRRFLWAALAGVLIPYGGSMMWTGSVRGEELRFRQQRETSGTERILLDRGGSSYYVGLEDYLPGVLARQIPADYEPEALKAQAVIARTYIRGQLESAGEAELAESALDLDYLETEQLKRLWGTDQFPEYYQKMENAVTETKGKVMRWEGACIQPLFCRASAGQTRAGDEDCPYLQSVECPADQNAPGAEQTLSLSPREAAAAINGIPESGGISRSVREEALLGELQIISRDSAGYVEELQIEGANYRGEEVQYALGLQSACFSLRTEDGRLRAEARGIGHGYGLSQYTANELAKEGWLAEDILAYFYKNIVITE